MSNNRFNVKKLTIFLMTEKGYRFLEEMISEYRELFEVIVVGSDKSIEEDFEQEIIALCNQHSIPYVRREKFRSVDSEYVMAISWRWMIDHPEEKLIVLHDSLLPRYRGFSPLVNSLINGENHIGVTAIFGASDFDTGDIISQIKVKVEYPLKIADAISILSRVYCEVARNVLDVLIANETLIGSPQDCSKATYSLWRDEHDYNIDWTDSAERIVRFIDAVGYPYKGARTTTHDGTLRVVEAIVVQDVNIENRVPGKVLFIDGGKPVVVCGSGLIKITRLETISGVSILPYKKFRFRFGTPSGE